MADHKPTTSRRTLLAAAALASPLAAVPALAAVTADPHPDAALLALGRRFDAARLEAEAMRPEYLAAREAVGAHVEASRDRIAVAAREGRDNGAEFWDALFREADPDDVSGRWDTFLQENVDPLTTAILLAPPPTTIEGLAVKARAVIEAMRREIWTVEDPREELDFDEELIRNLVEAVLRLAGVDEFGRPMNGETAHV